jgi:hypothetical protein
MKPSPQPDNQAPLPASVSQPVEFDFSTPAYERFSESIDKQVTELVALWQHLAAPRALRIGRSCSLPVHPE